MARGELREVLPRVHVGAGSTLDTAARVAALHLFDPDAVILGAASAALTWWPELPVESVLATRRGQRVPIPGYAWTKARFPEELLVATSGGRIAGVALSVLQLTEVLGGDAIDEALRRRVCTLDELWDCHHLLAGRRGTRERLELLEDSRDEPWSPAERRFHRHYRAVGCRVQHATNHPVTIEGAQVFLDLAIPDLELSFEIDGYETHGGREAFEWDRDRGTLLATDRWHEVRWSAWFVTERGEETRRRIRAIIAARATVLGIPISSVLAPE